jgi:glycine cleavage system H protein
MVRPEELRYTQTHEWVKITGKNTAIIGITDYAVTQLRDIIHIELPKVGEEIEQGSPCGEIESVKTVADFVAPLSGKVTAVNKDLLSDLDVLKDDPYEEGWFIKIRLSDPSEVDSLMSVDEYNEFVESQEEESEERFPEEEEEDLDEEYFM